MSDSVRGPACRTTWYETMAADRKPIVQLNDRDVHCHVPIIATSVLLLRGLLFLLGGANGYFFPCCQGSPERSGHFRITRGDGFGGAFIRLCDER